MIGSFSLLFAFSFGIVGLSFFVQPVTEDLGLERGAFSFYFSIIFLVGMFVAPFMGKIINRWGPRRIVLTGSVVCSTAFFLFSYASSLAAFYAAAVLMGLLFQGTTVLSATTSVNMWFEKKRGQVLGIVASASGVGGAMLSLILPRLIHASGWQAGYRFMALLWLFLTLPTGLFLIRNQPAHYQMAPFGAEQERVNGELTTSSIGVSLRTARKAPVFYLMLLGMLLGSLVMSVMQHLPSHFSDIGLSDARMSTLMTTYSLFIILTKIIFGTLSDKIGLLRSLAILSCSGIISYILINSTEVYAFLLISVVMMAVYNPTMSVMPSIITFRIFGNVEFPAIWALIGMAGSFGQFVGPPLWGYVYDVTGSYQLVFLILPFLILAAFSLFVYCLKHALR